MLIHQFYRPMTRAALVLLTIAIGGCVLPVGDSEPKLKQLTVQLVDADGKPVEGAEIGILAGVGKDPKESAKKDQTEWLYNQHTRSNAEGIAHIERSAAVEEWLARLNLIARHEGRKIAAVTSVSPDQFDKPIKLTLEPEREILGEVVCKELAGRKRIEWLVVYVYFTDKTMLECTFDTENFRLPLPPGEYELEAYGNDTHHTRKRITVNKQESEQRIKPIELRATKFALLEGKPAPEIPDVVAWKNSKPLTLADLRGKCVLLDFWGYWCGPCIHEMPEIFKLHDKYHDQGLEILGVHIDLGKDEENNVDTSEKLDKRLVSTREKLWKGRDLPFPVALVIGTRTPFGEGIEGQGRSGASALYGITSYPTQVLIDRKGNVVGEFSPNAKGITLLEKVLAEK